MTRRQLSDLKKLLRSRNIDEILQAVELAASLDDDEIFDALLEGADYVPAPATTTLDEAKQANSQEAGYIVPSRAFGMQSRINRWHQIGTALLLSRSRHPLANKVTELSLGQGIPWMYTTTRARLRFPDLSGLPNLERLELHLSGEFQADIDLVELQTIRELRIVADSDDPLLIQHLVDLEVLHLGGMPLHADSQLPGVQELSIRDVDFDLGTMTPNLQKLSCASITPSSLKNLESPVTFQHAVDDTRRVPLQVHCGDLSPIVKLRSVEMMTLTTQGRAYISVEPLAQLSSLRAVDARCIQLIDLEKLDGHPELRLIACDPNQVDKKQLPKKLRAVVSIAKTVDFVKAVDKPKPGGRPRTQSSVSLSAESKKIVSKIRNLVTTPDLGTILQGVELAKSAGDSSVFEALLEGCEPNKDDKSFPVRGKYFVGAQNRQAWLDLAMVHLIAASDLPLRSQITTVSLTYGSHRNRRNIPYVELELRGLDRLDELEQLSVSIGSQMTVDLQPLSAYPRLKRLTVNGNNGDKGLPPLEYLEELTCQSLVIPSTNSYPALRSITGQIESVGGLSSKMMPALQSLSSRFRENGDDLVLEGFTSLDTLKIHGPIRVDLPECEAIEEMDLAVSELQAPELRSVEAIVHCPPNFDVGQLDSLGEIDLNQHKAYRGGRLPEGTKLSDPWVFVGGGAFADIGNLGELPGLEILAINDVTTPQSLESLRNAKSLRVLDIRNSPGITDISPLVGLPELRLIALHGSGVTDGPRSLMHVVSTDKNVDVRTLSKGPIPELLSDDEDALAWKQIIDSISGSSIGKACSAVDRAAELGDEAIERLLVAVTVRRDYLGLQKPFAVKQKAHNGPIVGQILSHASEDSAAANELRTLETLRFNDNSMKGRLNLGFLTEFPALRTIAVSKLGSAFFPFLPENLERLTVHTAHAGFRGSVPGEHLRVLSLTNGAADEYGHFAGSNVESLLLGPTGLDLGCHGGDLEKFENLKHLYIPKGWIFGLDRVKNAPIEHIAICPNYNLTELIGHPTIRSIELLGDWSNKPIPRGLPAKPTANPLPNPPAFA